MPVPVPERTPTLPRASRDAAAYPGSVRCPAVRLCTGTGPQIPRCPPSEQPDDVDDRCPVPILAAAGPLNERAGINCQLPVYGRSMKAM